MLVPQPLPILSLFVDSVVILFPGHLYPAISDSSDRTEVPCFLETKKVTGASPLGGLGAKSWGAPEKACGDMSY